MNVTAAMPTGRVVCIGESMAQVVPTDGRLDGATSFAVHCAGAESNVAIALAYLGTPSSWVSRVGDDPLGRRVAAAVGSAGVDTSLAVTDPRAPTGVFFKDPEASGSRVYYYRVGSAASRMGPSDLDRMLRAAPRWVHTSGVTSALSPSCRGLVAGLLDAARDAAVPTSFDVNHRPALWQTAAEAAEVLAATAQHADVVFVGLDEAETLWGCADPAAIRRVLDRPTTVVVKDGGLAAHELAAGSDPVCVRALPVEVIEPVGAGDAFAAGWIHGHLHGFTSAQRLRLGHLAAGIALQSRDDHGDLADHAATLADRARTGIDWCTPPAGAAP